MPIRLLPSRAVVAAIAIALLGAAPAHAQTAYRDRPAHPLAGCWRIDAHRTLTLDGTRGEIAQITLEGFAPTPIQSSLTWLPRPQLLVVDAPGTSGFAYLTVSLHGNAAPTLDVWERDHRRYMTRAWRDVHHAVHPLAVTSHFALTRCTPATP